MKKKKNIIIETLLIGALALNMSSYNLVKGAVYDKSYKSATSSVKLPTFKFEEYITSIKVYTYKYKWMNEFKEQIKKNVNLEEEKFNELWTKVEKRRRIYPVKLNYYSKDYTKQYIVITDVYDKSKGYGMWFFATDNNHSKVKLISQFNGNFAVNYNKLQLGFKEGYMGLWSQMPMSVSEMNCLIKLNGNKFELVNSKFNDKIIEYCDKKLNLLKNNKIEDAMKLEKVTTNKEKYLKQYEDVAREAILTSYKHALELDAKDNTKKAIEVLKWGIDEYVSIHTDGNFTTSNLNKLDIFMDESRYETNNLIPIEKFAGILNDYGFFLSKCGDNKNSEKILLKVIEFSPKRTVAYLNLGDISWDLNKKEEAKKYYKSYLELLSSNTKNVPSRVYDRIK